ncbi:MAG: LuxR family transcriptional regulator [Ilumatobacteraceae bacterium]|nr:LuxR family transcriptional regulator [Ilumatobacteraceae bacterium]
MAEHRDGRERDWSGLAQDWPLIGRGDVLDRFTALLAVDDAGPVGGSRGVALLGAPGVGKTRLAGACADIAAQHGRRIGRISGSRAAASIPFGAAASLLSTHGSGGSDFATIIRDAYESLTARGELCLVIDDAHLLDDASITLVQHLAGSRSVALVVTARSDRPVAEGIAALWRNGGLAKIDVDGLDRTSHHQLVATALGGPMDATAAGRLFEASGGNPLFTRELLMAAADDNALFADGHGGWRVGRLPRSSSRLAELVAGRIGALDDDERRCLETIAVAEPIGLDVIEAMGFGPAVARLERRRLVMATTAGRRIDLTIAHPLYADTVRDRLLPIRARNIRRALADQLEQTGARRRGDASRMATWRLDAGLTVPVVHLSVAADEALVAGDVHSAERFARAAHDAAPTLATAVTLARALRRGGDAAAAEVVLGLAEGLTGPDVDRDELLLVRAGNAFWNLGRDDQPFALLAARSASSAAALAGELDVARGARPAPDDPTELRVLGLLRDGRPLDALELLRAAADRAIHPGLEAFVLAFGGWLSNADALARATQRPGLHPSAHPLSGDDGWALLAGATCRLEDGDGQRALRSAEAAADAFADADRWIGVAACAAREVDALVLLGETTRARQRLQGCAMHMRTRIFGRMLDRAEARLLAAEGALDRAQRMLEELVAAAHTLGQDDDEQSGLHDLHRLGAGSPARTERLRELADRIASPRALHRGRHVGTAGDGARLGLLAAELETDGFAVWAYEVSIEAAARLTEAGATRQAGSEQRRATRLRSGFPRAALLAPAETSVPTAERQLRPGELQVVRLAADGLSDREIGEQLHLSVRTVGNYLLRAYRRLGVRGRDELREALVEHQLLNM